MRNGLEAVTIVYENNKISHLKKRIFGSPSYEFERNKPSRTTIENRIDVLSTMFFCRECHINFYYNSTIYRFYLLPTQKDVRTS